VMRLPLGNVAEERLSKPRFAPIRGLSYCLAFQSLELQGSVGTVIPAGKIERDERKQTASGASKTDQVMSKPGADPSSGISSVDVLIPTERHPACRQREAPVRNVRTSPAMPSEKNTSGSNREAESTDAPERSGLGRRNGVMGRRGWGIVVERGPNGSNREEPQFQGSLRAMARAAPQSVRGSG
jgi:hypothetical protein